MSVLGRESGEAIGADGFAARFEKMAMRKSVFLFHEIHGFREIIVH
jgi:hypothetical protein